MASLPPALITPKFLLPYPAPVNDYRCVVKADATAVIVERTTFTADGAVAASRYAVLGQDRKRENLRENPAKPLRSLARATLCAGLLMR